MRDYLLSLPERVLRSATALAAGLLNQVGEAALPGWLRRTRLYRNLVEATLRFLVEKVGEVEGVFPAEGQLAEDFLLRRAAGNGIELVGILTFHASPVWLLAALADLSGAGRTLISEIAASLREAGLIAPDSHPASVDQVLDALESASARAAESINTPPLDVAGLRAEWSDFRRSFERLPAASLPGIDKLEETWRQIRETARAEKRGVFELSALLALETLGSLPRGFIWLGRSAGVAGRRTGAMLSSALLDHYTETLATIRKEGLPAWWLRQFRPYLAAAAHQFSRHKPSLTESWLRRPNARSGGS